MSTTTKKPRRTHPGGSATGRRSKRAPIHRPQRRAAAVFVLPFMVLYAFVYLAPIGYSMVQIGRAHV